MLVITNKDKGPEEFESPDLGLAPCARAPASGHSIPRLGVTPAEIVQLFQVRVVPNLHTAIATLW